MDKLFTSGNQATNSDLAFWGNYAFVGYYTGGAGFPPTTPPSPRGGVRIFDISNPASPRLVRDFACDGAQNDPILWDRNGNGTTLPKPGKANVIDHPNPQTMDFDVSGGRGRR